MAFRLTPRHASAIEEEIAGGVRIHSKRQPTKRASHSAERSTILGREVLVPYIFYDQA